MNLWYACEAVARQREKVGEDYTLCAADLKYPKGERQTGKWQHATVGIGRKQTNGKWEDIRELQIKPIEVAELLADSVPNPR